MTGQHHTIHIYDPGLTQATAPAVATPLVRGGNRRAFPHDMGCESTVNAVKLPVRYLSLNELTTGGEQGS